MSADEGHQLPESHFYYLFGALLLQSTPLRALGDGRLDGIVSRTPVPELLQQLDPQRVTLPGN